MPPCEGRVRPAYIVSTMTRAPIDVLIDMAASAIGCTASCTPPADPMEARMVHVLNDTGEQVLVQVPAKATLETVISLLLAGYQSGETD